MPFEISIVSVPADSTVGVGRELETEVPGQDRGNTLAMNERQLAVNKNYI